MTDKSEAWTLDDDLDEGRDVKSTSTPEAECPVAAHTPLNSIRCPACGGTGEEADPRGWSRCSACGTRFGKDRPSQGQLAQMRDALFAGCFASPLHAEKHAAREQAMQAMKGFWEIRRGRAVALNAFGCTALDVNCGVGFRMRILQDYGWAAAGTETSSDAFEYARRQTLDVRHGWLREADFGRTRFDLAIFCGNVGEHADPASLLDHLHVYLRREALVCVLDEPLSQSDADVQPGDTRVALFTADGMKRLFGEHRFRFLREEIDAGCGTFWFQAKQRN